MKAIHKLITLLLLASFNPLHAQDSIFMKDQQILIGKVNEISKHEIRYHRVDNLEGPVYVLKSYDVDKVKFSNGEVKTIEYVSPWLRLDSVDPAKRGQSVDVPVQQARQDSLSNLEQDKAPLIKNLSSLNTPSPLYVKHFDFYKNLSLQTDPFIKKEFKKSKFYGGMSALGFTAVPMALTGFFSFLAASEEKENSQGRKDKTTVSLVSIAGTLATLGFAIRMSDLKSYHLKRATDAYSNQINEKLKEERKNQAPVLSQESKYIHEIRSNRYVYQGQIYSKEEIQSILLSKQLPEIDRKINMAIRGERVRWVALADVPLTLAGIYLLSKAVDAEANNNGNTDAQEIRTLKQQASALFISGAVCFSIGIAHQGAYRKNTQKSIRLYNQNYAH